MSTSTSTLVATRHAPPPPSPPSPPASFSTLSVTSPRSSCPSCGTHIQVPIPIPVPSGPPNAEEAHERIFALEAQVRLLHSKAAAAADRLADYEDEVRFLRSSQGGGQNGTSPPATKKGGSNSFGSPWAPPETVTFAPAPQQHQPQQQSRLSSLTSLIPGRRVGSGASSPLPPPTPGLPPSDAADPAAAAAAAAENLNLAHLLQQEKKLRLAAENSLSQAHSELEELTAQLFSQANEMVATERRARAKLEERVAVLEARDGEKRLRLDRLERAVERVERVRGLVGG